VARGTCTLVDPVERDLVEKALEGLPKLQAQVIRALYIDGDSVAQVAERWGLSTQAVQNLHQRGLKAMKQRLRFLGFRAPGTVNARAEIWAPDSLRMLADSGERAMLERALGALHGTEIEAICALYFAGASEQEIVEQYGLTLDAVRELRRRGFHALLLYLRRLAEDPPTVQ
jgi:DNA-directed RNA polymerase specialized sigma24 family protein